AGTVERAPEFSREPDLPHGSRDRSPGAQAVLGPLRRAYRFGGTGCGVPWPGSGSREPGFSQRSRVSGSRMQSHRMRGNPDRGNGAGREAAAVARRAPGAPVTFRGTHVVRQAAYAALLAALVMAASTLNWF